MKKNKIVIGLICALTLTSVPFTTFAQGNNNDKGAVKQEVKQTVQTQATDKKPEVKEQTQDKKADAQQKVEDKKADIQAKKVDLETFKTEYKAILDANKEKRVTIESLKTQIQAELDRISKDNINVSTEQVEKLRQDRLGIGEIVSNKVKPTDKSLSKDDRRQQALTVHKAQGERLDNLINELNKTLNALKEIK